jgi:hypothetical protein
MWHRVDLVRTDSSERRVASLFKVERISEVETTLVVVSNRSKLGKNINCMRNMSIREGFMRDGLRKGPPLWSSRQSSWLLTQRSRARFPALPNLLRSSGSGTGSTQSREDKWGATWKKSSGSGLENLDWQPWGIRRADHATSLYPQKLALNFTGKWRPVAIVRLWTKGHIRMASSGTLRRVAAVRTDVSGELSASLIRVTRIGELGRTLAATSNRCTRRRQSS